MAAATKPRKRRTAGRPPKPDGPMIPFTVKVTPDLLARIDAKAKEMQREHPGLTLSRSDVARALLERGLG